MENKENLVPLDQVIEDMYSKDGGIVSSAARDYYYLNYASPEERRSMDIEDNCATIFAIVMWALIIGGFVLVCILGVFGGMIW